MKAILGLIRKGFPLVIFLMEIKCLKQKINSITVQFRHSVVVDSFRHRGGLVLVWNSGIDIFVEAISDFIIGVKFIFFYSFKWRLWCYHCPNIHSLK